MEFDKEIPTKIGSNQILQRFLSKGAYVNIFTGLLTVFMYYEIIY